MCVGNTPPGESPRRRRRRLGEAVRTGEKPPLEMNISGGSYASNRIILSVTMLDLVREVGGGTRPVDVKLVESGNAGLPISVRLVPPQQ